MDGLLKAVAVGVGALLAGGTAYAVGCNVGATKRLQKQYKDDGLGEVSFKDAHGDLCKIVQVARAIQSAQ